MRIRGLTGHMAAMGLLLLTGCEATRNMRADLVRLTSPQANAAPALSSKPVVPRPRPPTGPTSNELIPPNSATISPADTAAVAAAAPEPPSDGPTVALAGKSATEVRALFGAPASEEDRPPGKRWRYGGGSCTLIVQLYPDVQTKQFGTLAYEVRSDDNSDEGKRRCLAQLQSRVQTRN